MRSGTARAGVAIGLSGAMAIACGHADRAGTANASAAAKSGSAIAASATSPSFLAFRSDGHGGFDARGEAHEVRATADGAVFLSASGARDRSLSLRNADAASVVGPLRRDSDGALAIPHRDYVERWTNVEDGVEQAWRFDRAPSGDGSGDVLLSILPSGLSYLGRTPRGLHFGTGGHGGGMRYGDGEWVDADGTRTAIEARWTGDRIALTVPRALIASSHFPATLDPLVGPEVTIDQPSAAVPWEQTRPAAAASASSFYLAWMDSRRVGFSLVEGSIDIYGARVDPTTGHAFDADGSGVPLLQGVFYEPTLATLFPPQSPVVTSDGTNFLVAISAGGTVAAARVDGTTGLVLPASDPGVDGAGSAGSQLTVATFSSEQGGDTRMGAAFGGGKYILAWTDSAAISIARIDPATGALEDPGGRRIAPSATSEQVDPKLACGGPSCVVTWVDSLDGNPHVARFDPASGATVAADGGGPVLALPTAGQEVLAIAYDPTAAAYVMAWATPPYGTSAGVHASFFDPVTGALRSGAGVQLTADATNEFHLTFDGVAMVASWPTYISSNGTDDVSVATLDASTLAPAARVGVLGGTSAVGGGASDLATTGQTSLVVAGETLAQSGETVDQVRGARFVDTSDSVVTADVGGVSVVGSSNEETAPALASSGTNVLLAWQDTRAPHGAIVATRLDMAGMPLTDAADAAGIVLGAGAPGGAFFPAVASNGSDYLVVWLQESATTGAREIDGARIDGTSGAVTGSLAPIPYASSTSVPSLTFDGTNYALAVADVQEIVVVRLDGKTLAPVGSPTILTPVTRDVREVYGAVIAAGGGAYLVAWQTDPAILDVSAYVAAARIDSSGTVFASDGNGVQLSSATSVQRAPSVAYGNGSFVVSWLDTRDGAGVSGVYGRQIPLTGSIVTSAPDIAIGKPPASVTGLTVPPAMANAGDGLSVQTVWGWQDDLYGGLVSYAGIAREPTPLTVAETPGDVEKVALASLAPGSMLLAYSRLAASNAGGNYHVYTRTLSTGPLTGTCKGADDCASRYCSDGFCCDTPCSGACETCAATPGKCTSVTSANDPDTCAGAETCSASGACGEVNGTACARAADCASGNCVDDVCCESACSGGCDVCNAVPGTCTVVASGSSGASPSCTPYVCDGASAICPILCSGDQGCERPYSCAANGKCELLTGAVCVDADTLRSATGVTSSCAPYACSGSTCLATCSSIADCGAGFVCDDTHRCVAPAAIEGGGCDVGGSTRATTGSGGGFGAFFAAIVFALSRSRARTRRKAKGARR